MKSQSFEQVRANYRQCGIELYLRCSSAVGATIRQRDNEILFSLGIALLYIGLASMAYAGRGTYGQACDGLLQLVEGTFGALITAAAGVGAIVASAVGGFKMAWGLVVVSVGAFILRSFITLFNGTCGCPTC